MTPASSSRTRDVILELAETLADVAAADTEYRSVYLSRARALLASVVSRAALEAIRGERGRLGGLREEARRALETGDWHRVRKLALALRDADRRVAESEGVFRVAEHVYDADTGIARDALPAYTVSPLSTDALRSVQARTVRHLERLAASDAAWHPFYATRRDAVAALSMENRAEPAGAAEEAMWEQARQALRAGRWDALASLAEGLGGGRDPATLGCACGTLAEEPQTPDVGPPATELAARAGLFPTPLEARDDLRAFLSCRCARAPRLSTRALGEVDAGERSTTCGCHHRCPGLEERLRETLDVLKHRAFLSSLGTRYLPTFAAAVVLLETFPESEAERGPLLEELRLPRRLGLSRLEIEQALAMRGSDVVRDLGLKA